MTLYIDDDKVMILLTLLNWPGLKGNVKSPKAT
jgi:hypothetical protein